MLQPLCKTGCSATAKWQMMFFPQACVTNSYPFATESKFTQFFKCRYVVYWKELLDILSFFLLRKEKELPCLLTLSATVFSVLAWMCCSINISHFKEPFHVPHIFFILKAHAKCRSSWNWLYSAHHLCGPLEISRKSEQTFHALSLSRCKI